MPLRIVLDARRIADFGIGTYIRNLVRSLAKIDRFQPVHPGHSPCRTCRSSAICRRISRLLSIEAQEDRLGAARLYSCSCASCAADLFHIPLNAVPLWMPKPYMVTIHDMSTLLFANHQSGYRSNLRHFYLRRGLLRADRVMTVSIATRRDVESVLGIPASRIRVVYNAPDPIFCRPSAPARVEPRRASSPLILPRSSACWIATTFTIPFCCTSDAPIRRRTFPDWWRPSPCCAARLRDHPRYRESASHHYRRRDRAAPGAAPRRDSQPRGRCRAISGLRADRDIAGLLPDCVRLCFSVLVRRVRAAAAGGHGLRDAGGLFERQFPA